MSKEQGEKIIEHIITWIKSVVIGCNFCPFAASAMLRKSIRYVVLSDTSVENALEEVAREMQFLDQTQEIETTLLIFPNHFSDFESYLGLVDLAEDLSSSLGYDGIYQLASFHPEYCFKGSTTGDPANYTNRSVYPMIHILREDSITKALAHYPDPEGIPLRNIEFAKQKGLHYMQHLLASCKQ